MLVRSMLFTVTMLVTASANASTLLFTVSDEFYFPQVSGYTFTANTGGAGIIRITVDPTTDSFTDYIGAQATSPMSSFTTNLLDHDGLYLDMNGYPNGPGGPYTYPSGIASIDHYELSGGYYIRDEDLGGGIIMEDYGIELRAYGTSAGSGASVPEPSIIALLLPLVARVLARRKTRTR